MLHPKLLIIASLAALALVGNPVVDGKLAAQGAGSTAQQVMQLPTGARSAALGGAYTAAQGDVDVLFFNPAGITALFQGAGLAYQRHVADVQLGALAGAARVGPVVVGVGIAYLDGGEVPVIEPDPNFGGQRGIETGATVSARESATRLAVGVPLMNDRVYLGAAAGFAASDMAGVGRSAPFVDLGAQAAFPFVPFGFTLGAALRNLGGSMTGSGAEDAPLPTEARLGAAFRWTGPADMGVLLSGDLISRMREGEMGFNGGLEAGLLPADTDRIAAVLRAGFAAGGEGALGSLHLGAGVSINRLAVDYSFHNMEYFGAAHRIGIRWMRPAR